MRSVPVVVSFIVLNGQVGTVCLTLSVRRYGRGRTMSRFITREAVASDFEIGVRYSGAGAGVIDPGKTAEEVMGKEISFGMLFAYCFRRFGFPNIGSDEYKEIASYLLVTPIEGLFLRVSIKALSKTSLLFGYLMKNELNSVLSNEKNVVFKKFDKEFSDWRKRKGLLLPRETTPDLKDVEDRRNDMRLFDEYLKRYRDEGGLDYDDMPKGERTEEVLNAIRVTLEDLKSPVGVRDCLFSAVTDSFDEGMSQDEVNFEVPCHRTAGIHIPVEYMENEDRLLALTSKLKRIGDGSVSNGIQRFIET